MYTEQGRKTVLQGVMTELIIQGRLWNFGYNVARIPRGVKSSFDLFVDKKYRVDVKSTKIKGKTWTFSLSRGIEKGDVDIYAFVFIYPDTTFKVRYITAKNLLILNKNKGDVTSVTLTTKSDFLEKSPLKIFGTPKKKIKRMRSKSS